MQDYKHHFTAPIYDLVVIFLYFLCAVFSCIYNLVCYLLFTNKQKKNYKLSWILMSAAFFQ